MPAEAGIDRHDEDEVNVIKHVLDGAQRRRRIDRHADLLAEIADGLQRPVQMRSGFGMDGDAVTAGLSEGFEIVIDRRDHQMAIEGRVRVGTQRLDDVGTEGNVRHEMPVHYIKVDPVGAGGGDVAHLLAEPGEIRREDRGGNANRQRHQVSLPYGAICRWRRNSGLAAAHCVGAAGGKKPLPRHSSRR